MSYLIPGVFQGRSFVNCFSVYLYSLLHSQRFMGFFPPFVLFTMFVLLRMITSPCQGLITLVDNHLCHLMLKPILPQLQSHIHDTSEKVRVAMVNLLLKIKGVRAIKVSSLWIYYSLCPFF